MIARRDELLSPVTARLSRTVKRALGDDQNRLLDQLRNTPSTPSEELLGPEDAHVDTFAAAANEHLREAFAAGTVFAGTGAARVSEGDAVAQSAAGLAHVVVTMLRGKILDTGGDTADKVGAAYREWRGERVERLAGDYATQAFSAGVAAARADGKLRWVVASASGCSDCADNALAGAVSTSEGFPTGHAHPAGPFGLPLPRRCRRRLTRASGRRRGPGLATAAGVVDVRLPSCASRATFLPTRRRAAATGPGGGSSASSWSSSSCWCRCARWPGSTPTACGSRPSATTTSFRRSSSRSSGSSGCSGRSSSPCCG